MMSVRVPEIAILSIFALALLTPDVTQASSHAKPHESLTKAGLSDISAAQKKKKQKPRVQAAPQPYAAGWGGWRPADPSFDQYGRRYLPPPGLSCPVDLGYGRWASCNDDF